MVNGVLTRTELSFPVAKDVSEYGLAVSDQRHRAVLNGIFDAGYGIQMSGLYFYGSGVRFGTTYGSDLRDAGVSRNRLRPDGTIVPRNALVGSPLHRVDLRLQKKFGIGGQRSVSGMLDVFNAFNHANYGTYTTTESSASYGKPSYNSNIAYQARMVQLGLRLAF